MKAGRPIRTRTIALALSCALLGTLALAPASEAAPPTLWEKCPNGSGAGQCVIPRGLATSPLTGHVYVADQSNSRVNEFTAWGEFVKAWGWGVRDGTAELQTCGPGTSPPSSSCQEGLKGSGAGQFDGGVEGIATDSAGDVYVVDRNNHRVQKFGPEGNFILTFGGEVNKTTSANVCTDASGDVCGVGAEGSANGFFGKWPFSSYIDAGPGDQIYVGDNERVQVFDTGGGYLKSIAVPGEAVQSLAVDPVGDLYLAYVDEFSSSPTKPNVRKLSPSGSELCTLGVKSPTAIATDAAGYAYVFARDGFNSDPHIRKFNSSCGEVESFDAVEFADSTGIAIGEGPCLSAGADVYVANSVHGDSFVRAYGPSPDKAELCPPPLLAPSIEAQFATSTDSAGAILKAKINPHFWPDARYYVQYGTGKCTEGGCEATQPAPPGALLTKEVADTVRTTSEVFLSGLEPDTTYRYRFVAESGGGGPVLGEERGFHTLPLAFEGGGSCPNQAFRTGPSAKLPDCRAYELVSPLDKNNGDVTTPATNTNFAQASIDGQRMTFSSSRAFAGAPSAALTSQYLAERTGAGWSARAISPPSSSLRLYTAGSPFTHSAFKAFSDDLCSGWVLQLSDLTLVPGAPEGVPNLYRRENCGEDSYELLSSTPPPGFGFTSVSAYRPHIQAFSADDSISVFRANASLAVAEGGPRAPLVCSTDSAGTISYQWYRNGTPIGGATEPTHLPTAADEGMVLQCEVTATDAQGASTATSVTSLIGPSPGTAPPDPGFLRATIAASIPLPGAPEISGIPAPGQTLTCTPGTWKGSPTFAYEWLRGGTPIGGAIAAEYTLQAADKGKSVQCRTIAANADGAAVATSVHVVVAAEPPTASAVPTISGTPEVGQTLTCNSGTWAGAPTFAYQWLRNGANVIGATAATRTLAGADAGKAIQCRVTASNADSGAQATSDRAVVPVAPATTPPQLTAPGAVTGDAQVGKTLTCDPGTWSGSPAFAFKWLRNGAPIAGATEAAYKLEAADVAKTIQCQVTATNAGASVVAIDASSGGARYVDPNPPAASVATTGPAQLYLSDGSGQLRLVSVLPDGSVGILNGSVGTRRGDASDAGFRSDSSRQAVSEDGERVFWTATDFDGGNTDGGSSYGPGKLYLRFNATEPQSEVSGGQCTEASKACTIPVSESALTEFVSANPEGTRALYTVGADGEELYEAEIEEVAGQQVAGSQPIAKGVKGVMGAGEDATRVYFASTEVLSGAQQNSEGEAAVAGEPNLYLYERGVGFTFVAGLSEFDFFGATGEGGAFVSPLDSKADERLSRVSPDGLGAAFTSPAQLTGYDNTDQQSGEPDAQVFVFDATAGGDGELRCASCNPSGARPNGGRNVAPGLRAAALIPGWNSQFQPSHLLSDDGNRLFFNAYDSLVPGDTNGKADVYQWEAPGKGDCTEESPSFSEDNGGCVSLISSGQSATDSEIYDATPSGSDVFFSTQSSLVPEDFGLTDVYDARVNGGLPGPPAQPASCEGEACQGPTAPPDEQSPASASFQGPGNVRRGGPSRCRRGKVRRAGRCVKKPRKHQRHRRAGDERRAER